MITTTTYPHAPRWPTETFTSGNQWWTAQTEPRLEDAPDAPDDTIDEGPDFDPSTRGPDGPAPVPPEEVTP